MKYIALIKVISYYNLIIIKSINLAHFFNIIIFTKSFNIILFLQILIQTITNYFLYIM